MGKTCATPRYAPERVTAWGRALVAASEIPINTVREGTTATAMAQTIFGDGVITHVAI